ncbi:MAG: PAS domain S-box protein [Smithellaceae bacterium]|nr:PAS domain S-box protein [Smithellaceae bacterium]
MTKTSELRDPTGPFHRFLGIRASLIGIMMGLLSISLILVLYSMYTLNNTRTAMNHLATQDLAGLVMAQQIENEFRSLIDELQGIPFIGSHAERQQKMASIKQLMKRLLGDLQQMGGMNFAALAGTRDTGVGDLEKGLGQLDQVITRYDQITGRRIAAREELKIRQERIDRVYASFISAAEDTNRQMRAFVSRSLAVNIPNAAKQGRLQQELDTFLEREMSWLGTAQDLRNDGRELKTIADAVGAEMNPAALNEFARQAAAASLRLSMHSHLTQTPVVRNLAVLINDLTGQFSGNHPQTLFLIRKMEIEVEKQAQTQYDQIVEMSRHLQRDAAKIVGTQNNMVRLAVQKTNSDVRHANKFLLGFSLAAAALSFLALYYLLGVRVIRRIEGLTRYMRLSASEAERGKPGRLEEDIRKLIGGGHDEIAAMGKAFIVFVDAILAEKDFSETAINSLPGIFYMYDRQGRLVLWNRNIETFFGYAPEEIKGSNIMTFIAEADRARVRNAMEKAFVEGYGEVEAELITKDNVMIPYYLTGVQMTKGDTAYVIGTGIKLTELKKSAEALKESERKYRELVENANSIILRWNPSGEIAFMNEFGQKFFGYTEKEIIGRHLVGTIVPEKKNTGRDLRPLVDGIVANPKDFEQNINENMRRNGERVWISWTNKAVLDRNGQVLEVLSIGSDITERRQAEEMIQASLLEKETMLSEIYHRAKNNMQVISSLLNMQSSYLQDETAREALQDSVNRVKTMADIHNLLYHSGNMTRIDIGGFIRDLTGSLQQSYKISGAPIEIHADIVDATLPIEQAVPCGLILNELISNALKHAFPEGKEGKINITMQLQNNHVTLTVCDNGIGFRSVTDAANRKSMGMELVNILVGQIGGKLDMQVDGGTTWTITFPIKKERVWLDG